MNQVLPKEDPVIDWPISGSAEAQPIRRIQILGLPLDAVASINEVVAAVEARIACDGAFLTTFINPSAVALTRRNPGFGRMLSRFDLVLPDGIGIVKAVAHLHGLSVARISFDSTSLAPSIFAMAQRAGRGVALVGGAPGVAERAAAHIRATFPHVRLVAALDGYGDRSEKIEQIRIAGADIVVCGMGGVAQEEFLLALAGSGWRGCGFTCGGYLDQLGAGMRYYPAWVDRANLRFAYRLLREPRRLWRRYLIDYQVFVILFLRALVAQRLAAARAT
jgi:N-acetylglucosaminyldiphosphoundecaprenol N-acetyl-beta-D-mannosaminyltransferase